MERIVYIKGRDGLHLSVWIILNFFTISITNYITSDHCSLIKMRFTVLTSVAALASSVQAYYLSGFGVPETVAPGDTITVKCRTAIAPVSINSVAATFGLITDAKYQRLPELGVSMGSVSFIGKPALALPNHYKPANSPADQDISKDSFERAITVPKDAKHGDTTIGIAYFQNQGSFQAAAVEYYYANVTVGDETSAEYTNATFVSFSQFKQGN